MRDKNNFPVSREPFRIMHIMLYVSIAILIKRLLQVVKDDVWWMKVVRFLSSSETAKHGPNHKVTVNIGWKRLAQFTNRLFCVHLIFDLLKVVCLPDARFYKNSYRLVLKNSVLYINFIQTRFFTEFNKSVTLKQKNHP